MTIERYLLHIAPKNSAAINSYSSAALFTRSYPIPFPCTWMSLCELCLIIDRPS
ncbi:hypothetical protein [Pedobacter montanisoli]|uniref:Uncharacterized protein n=1 Tax=Pedobacter montanisoli TaxID=2923277 RepID=A0ABS9ZUG1_9SPHI|nr:hypothetical protein [Pedobacter montanisoli]MCJ0742158.1 hypothetical protein [Pedobacter montanisoli]